MYGLEKKERDRFAFDLERDIATKSGMKEKILKKAEDRMHAIKKMLREGAKEKEFDQLGILLHGYAALQKVIRKVK